MSQTLTYNQIKTLNIASGVSATLSLCGSSAIMYKTTLSDRKNPLKNVYQRILFGMSFFDIFQSIASGLSTILAPRDSPIVHAYGNVITCEMMGFFTIVSYSTFFYVSALSLHYVLTIAYGMKEAREKKLVEPYMHLVSILIPLALAIGALVTDQYNFAGCRCWVNAYPFGCEDDESVECTRGLKADQWIYALFSVTLSCFLFVSVCMTVVFVSVRRQEKKMQTKYSTLEERIRGDDERDKRRKSLSSIFRSNKEEFNHTDAQKRGSFQLPRRSSFCSVSTSITQGSLRRLSFTALSIPSQKQSAVDLLDHESSEINDKGNISSNVGSTAHSVFASPQSHEAKFTQQLKLEYKKSKKMSKKTKNLAIQGMLYVTIMLLMLIFGYINRGLQIFKGYISFPFMLLSSIFYPLQGFLNLFVYIRPRVLRIKQENKHFSYLKAMYMAIFETEENARRRRSSVNRFVNPKAIQIIKKMKFSKESSDKTSTVETPIEIRDMAKKSHSSSNAAVVGQQTKLSNDHNELPNKDNTALDNENFTPHDDGVDLPFNLILAKIAHKGSNNVASNDDMYVNDENMSNKDKYIDSEQHDNTTSSLYDKTTYSNEEDSKPVTSTTPAIGDFNKSSLDENKHVIIQSIDDFDVCCESLKSLKINSANDSLSLCEESDSLSRGSTNT